MTIPRKGLTGEFEGGESGEGNGTAGGFAWYGPKSRPSREQINQTSTLNTYSKIMPK